MNNLNRQGGYGTLLAIVLVLLASIGGAYYQNHRVEQAESIINQNELTAEELKQISSALTTYYRDNSSWPSSLNELKSSGYFDGVATRCGGNGTFQSSLCTVIQGVPYGDDYQLSVNLLKSSTAKFVANQIPGGSASGTSVIATIKRPFQATLYADYLQRVNNPDNPSSTQLETSIDVNHNELLNINKGQFESLSIDLATINVAKFKELTTEKVSLGSNSITSTGTNLDINASTVRLNGQVNLGGDLQANNHNLVDVGTVQASKGSFTDVAAQKGGVKQLSGDSVIFGTGQINNLSGESLNYQTGTITSLQGDSFTYNSGTVSGISGAILDFGAGTIGSVNGTSVNYNGGSINDLNGTSLNYTNGTFGTISGSTGRHTSLYVTGNTSLNTFAANNGTISTTTSDIWTFDSGIINALDAELLTVKNGATIDELNSNSIDTITGTATSLTGNTGESNGDVSSSITNTKSLVVNQNLTTGAIKSKNSQLGTSSSSSFNVESELIAAGINVSTFTANTGTLSTVSGTTLNYKTVSANKFVGGTYSSTSDFITPASSVNSNYLLVTEQKAKLDNCVDVTKFCLPETPSVSLSCSGCVSQASRGTFSGTATAQISQCRQGCTYQWINTGTGLSFSGCSSGSVPQGGVANPSCNISATLGPQESATGTVKLVVSNNHYADHSVSQSAAVSYQNTTANDPFATVKAGCWIDTPGFDTISPNNCLEIIQRESVVAWSVGDSINDTGERYYFSNINDWVIEFSGDCISSSYICDRRIPKPNRPKSYKAVVSVTHKPTGRNQVFEVTAIVEDGK
ncbi:hypothetical protein ACE02P_18080 [Shewanella bicestrii]